MISKQFMKTACAVATLAFVFGVMPIWSQDTGGGQGHGYKGHDHAMPSPEDRTDHLAKALNLSEDQKAKVLSAFQDEQKQMSALRSDTSTPREDKRSKMMQLHENTVSQVKGVLNPDQAKKFDAMQQEMKEHWGQKRGGGPEQ